MQAGGNIKKALFMDENEDYFTYRSWALRTHSGSLQDAIQSEMDRAQDKASQGHVYRGWWAYDGKATDPFALYTKWQPGRVTIASIAGLGSRKGRVPILCSAFEATGLAVRWEAVGNQHLRYALLRRGYTSSQQEPCFSADLILHPKA